MVKSYGKNDDKNHAKTMQKSSEKQWQKAKKNSSKKSTCIAGGFEQPPRRGLKESPIQTKLDLTV
ncbi:hypothetical protein [Shewanella algae]|uniref:hypothetical protein n=1 Tax=Shewanella algae TaxID=38313 RepID=UPI0031F58459